VRSTNAAGPSYAVFPSLLLLPPSRPNISSAPCSQTPLAYVLPLMCDSKFHTHTKKQETLQFCVQYTLSHPTLD